MEEERQGGEIEGGDTEVKDIYVWRERGDMQGERGRGGKKRRRVRERRRRAQTCQRVSQCEVRNIAYSFHKHLSKLVWVCC